MARHPFLMQRLPQERAEDIEEGEAVRPARRRHAIFNWPGAVSTRAVVRAEAVRPKYDYEGDLALPPAQRRAHAGCHPGRGRAPCSPEARYLHLARRRAGS